MSKMMLSVRDRQRSIHRRLEGNLADTVVAALSADPETIEELAAATARFVGVEQSRHFFEQWGPGTCDTPCGAGIGIVDLAARLVVWQSTWSDPGHFGQVLVHLSSSESPIWVRYHVSSEWHFHEEIDGWHRLAEERRQQRAATPPVDVREVLYGKLIEFFAAECIAASQVGFEDPVVDIHRNWLMTPRADLGGRAPREVLVANMDHINRDIEFRQHQWSWTGSCPPGIEPAAAAWRFSGIGVHEWVLYYELARYLLRECWQHINSGADASLESECDRLQQLKLQWLDNPDPELHGVRPREVIENERSRLPMPVPKDALIIDDDCPLCQMLAESDMPTFWHLDGCNMDNEFAFSWHPTREEWETEQREWEAFHRQMEAEEKLKAMEAASGPRALPDDAATEESANIWKRCFMDTDCGDSETPLGVAMFGIGACLAELGLDLKETDEARPLVKTLNRDFGNLRETMNNSLHLFEPVVQRLSENLDTVVELRPDLADKCGDLQDQVRQLAERVAPRPA